MRLRIGLLTSAFNRIVAAVSPLVVIPFALDSLGTAGYGAWAAATAIAGALAFADLGLGASLMTRLGRIPLESDPAIREARTLVSSAFAMTLLISTSLLIALGLSLVWVDWSRVLGSDASRLPFGDAIALAALGALAANITAGLIVRIQYGLGQQGRSNIWQTGASVLTVVAVWICHYRDVGPTIFIVVVSLTPTVAALANALVFFKFSPIGRQIAPRAASVDSGVANSVLRLGGRFFAVSVLMLPATALDPWIVAQTASVTDAAAFAVPARAFALVGSLSALATIPLWALYAEAFSRHDVEWVERTTRRMTLLLAVGVGSICAIGALTGPSLMGFWVGDQLRAPTMIWLGLACWWFVTCVTAPAFMVQNSTETLGPQTVGYAVFLVAIPLKWSVSAAFGYEWIPVVGAAAYVLIMWPSCLKGYKASLHGRR